jgi:hypothetical protein
LLIKALGIKKMMTTASLMSSSTSGQRRPIVVYDLTAGLGRDSSVILSSIPSGDDIVDVDDDGGDVGGATMATPPSMRLHMVERDPIVALLLTDAVRRLRLLAADDDDVTADDIIDDDDGNDDPIVAHHSSRRRARRICRCLSVEEGDAITVLHRVSASMTTSTTTTKIERPDVCYLDPMFPPPRGGMKRGTKKKSAVKKDMAMLHALLLSGEDDALAGRGVEQEDDDDANMDDVPKDGVGGSYGDEGDVDYAEARRRRMGEEERELLLAACAVAIRRVVVKRPVGAMPLGLSSSSSGAGNGGGGGGSKKKREGDVVVPRPTYDVRGSTNRFDVYVIS